MPAPPPRPESGFTLVELLISLALMVLLISAVAVILPRSMQLTRSNTLTAATNTTLISIVNQLNTDLDRSRPVLLTRASRTRLDFLQLGKPYAFTTTDGQDMDGQTTLRFTDGISSNPVGGEIVFLNTAGDYLITTITKTTQLPTGEHHLTVSCPMNLPGSVRAYTFTRASYAFADSIDPSDTSILFYGTPQQSLYHSAFLTQTGGSRTPASWGELISASNVQFAPVYGQTVGDFGTTLKAPQERLTVAGQQQPMTAINYAITAVEGGHPVTNAGAVPVHLAGKQQWTCGQDIGRPPGDTGTLQVNTSLETDWQAIGSPDVTVVGPTSTTRINSFAKTIRDGMMPGTYTAHADILDANGTSYDPHITGSPATVSAQRGGTINIDYQEAPGTLQIIEDGLPPQRASQIDGKEIYSAKSPVRARISIKALTSEILPGTYALTATKPTITVNGQTFIATPTSVTITARELTTVHVQWQPATGTALIHVQGLPASQPATFQMYTPSPYFLKDFTAPNGDVTIGQLQQGNYGLFAFHTPAGYVAKVTWTLGPNTSTGDGDTGTGIPIEPGQTTDVTVTYTLSTGNPSSGGGSGTYLIWGSVGYTVPTAIVHIRPGLEDHMNPAPAPMTAYVMDNLDAVSLPAGWYTIIVTDQKNNTLLYRTVTYLGNTPAFNMNQAGPEYGIQGTPMPSLATLYVGDNTQGNLVFYNLNDFNRPLKSSITTPNDGVVHTTLDQALLQYVGSFGVSDGGGGVLWQLQNQGLSVDYENYRPIQDNINNGSQSPVTQRNFCSMQKGGPSMTFQDCINAYGRFGKWW